MTHETGAQDWWEPKAIDTTNYYVCTKCGKACETLLVPTTAVNQSTLVSLCCRVKPVVKSSKE